MYSENAQYYDHKPTHITECVIVHLLAHSDPQAPFVPETPENLVVPMDMTGVPISCRVSDPYSHVILRSVPSGEEMSAYYDNKMGFFGSLSPGQYQCEIIVNGQAVRSVIYTVESEGKSRLTAVTPL